MSTHRPVCTRLEAGTLKRRKETRHDPTRRVRLNFFWRQTIVGLLRYAEERVPALAPRCARASSELDRTLASPWLEEAFELFQDAALDSHDPVFVTGAYYALRALDEVGRWERQAGGPIRLEEGLPAGEGVHPSEIEPGDHITDEVGRGIVELFDRLRNGATLEEALALFPHIGDEHSPE